MAIKIQNTDDWRSNGVKSAVYGFSGVGKTRLLATMPKPIILSAEKGLLSLAGDGIPYIEMMDFNDVQESFEFLQSDSEEAAQYESVGFDSLSEICEKLLGHLKPKHKDQRKAYMEMADRIGTLIRSIRDLENRNVCFLSKMVRKDDEETGKWWYEPMLPGRVLPNGLPYFVDEVFCMQIEDVEADDPVRYLQTQSSQRITCKDRSGVLDRHEPPNLGDIITKIKSTAPVD